MVKKTSEYISTLLKAGNFNFDQAEKVSGIPAPTIRKIVSGETDDPRFSTLVKLVVALGGDLNELVGFNKQKEIEINTAMTLKESYDMRAQTQTEYIESLKKDKRGLTIAVISLSVVIAAVAVIIAITLLILDIEITTIIK